MSLVLTLNFGKCFKHVSNGFKTRLNVFQTKTPKKRFTISPLFIWRVTYSLKVSNDNVDCEQSLVFLISQW